MRFDVFTLFPGAVTPYFEFSILQKAVERGLLEVHLHDIRAWTTDKHHVTDDAPYGGGGGMVIKPGPVFSAVEAVLGTPPDCPVVMMTPQGRLFNMRVAQELAVHPRLALLCGRYEGIDERVGQELATDEISIGDYVLTGGELAAMVVIDSVTRLLPGVLGCPDSADKDTFSRNLLKHPQYTRPRDFRGVQVPEVLMNGNHACQNYKVVNNYFTRKLGIVY